MALKDYAHWNEDAQAMWWAEEGRFGSEEPDYDPDDFLPYDDEEDDEEEGGHWENAFGQRLRDDSPRLPGDRWVCDDEPHIPEDAYLDQMYEDRIIGEEW